jgi:hypothetical protein
MKSFTEFWNGVEAEYKQISEKAVKILIPSARYYLCERGFSAVAMINCKY